jgi:hypothetical protein
MDCGITPRESKVFVFSTFAFCTFPVAFSLVQATEGRHEKNLPLKGVREQGETA